MCGGVGLGEDVVKVVVVKWVVRAFGLLAAEQSDWHVNWGWGWGGEVAVDEGGGKLKEAPYIRQEVVIYFFGMD